MAVTVPVHTHSGTSLTFYVSPLKVISTLSSKYHHHGHGPKLRTRTVMFPDFHALSVAVHIFLFSTAVSQFTSGPLAFLGEASWIISQITVSLAWSIHIRPLSRTKAQCAWHSVQGLTRLCSFLSLRLRSLLFSFSHPPSVQKYLVSLTGDCHTHSGICAFALILPFLKKPAHHFFFTCHLKKKKIAFFSICCQLKYRHRC